MTLNYYIIIIIILLILLYIVNNIKISNIDHFTSFKQDPVTKTTSDYASIDILDIKTDNKILIIIRSMLKDLHSLLTMNNITYWMDGGTLLGAVRHQNVIPWDDDGDLCIDNNDKSKFLALKPILNEMGYGLSPFWGGYKVYPFNGMDIKYQNRNWDWTDGKTITSDDINYKYPFIDIFFCENITENNKKIVHYANDRVKQTYAKYYHDYNDLYPLKSYKFDNFILMGPNNPKPYLDRAFGTDWHKVGYKNYDHENMKFLPVIKFKI